MSNEKELSSSPIYFENAPESPPPILFSSSPTFFQNAPESPPPISYTPVPGPTPEYHWSPPPQHYWGLPPQHCQCCVQRELSCGKQCVVVKVFRLGFSPSPDWHHNWHNSQHNWLQ
ncbi:uncharacterized protein LOC135375699 isoform X2 [Ornithodoros turicata]|uniref:uncharacterized protein LOC135375699 isoform X2 n=1 Tax=Ornithodoros turicata TaxID=34597 RepID=UPI003138A5C4